MSESSKKSGQEVTRCEPICQEVHLEEEKEKVTVQEHTIVMEDWELTERREIENVEDGVVVIRHTRKLKIPGCYDPCEYTVCERREKGKIMSTSISTEMSKVEFNEFQECWKNVREDYFMCHRSHSFLPPENQFGQEGLTTDEPERQCFVEAPTTQKECGADEDNF